MNVCDQCEYLNEALGLLQEVMYRVVTSDPVPGNAIARACKKDEHWDDTLWIAAGGGAPASDTGCRPSVGRNPRLAAEGDTVGRSMGCCYQRMWTHRCKATVGACKQSSHWEEPLAYDRRRRVM